MRIDLIIEGVNPLEKILNAIPTQESILTHSLINRIKSYFEDAGVFCDSDEDVLELLQILHDQGAINLEFIKVSQTYIIKNIYGQNPF